MGNSGLECDCDFDQWLGKLITSMGQRMRRTLIACQSVILRCNWQLDEAGVPSDTVARWERQRRKGQRDHEVDEKIGGKKDLERQIEILLLGINIKAIFIDVSSISDILYRQKQTHAHTEGTVGWCKGQKISERKLAMLVWSYILELYTFLTHFDKFVLWSSA